MQDEPTVPAGGRINGHPAPGPAERVLGDGPALDDLGDCPVAVLSAAVLRAARQRFTNSRTDLAVRAGVPPEVVAGAEDGTRPAWALSFFDFIALTGAVARIGPGLRGVFETAAACDLLLSCVLDGDLTLTTDVLRDPGSSGLARALLRLAVTGELRSDLAARKPAGLPEGHPLLSSAQVALLGDRAVALAVSGSPDAWVGVEILAAGWGERP